MQRKQRKKAVGENRRADLVGEPHSVEGADEDVDRVVAAHREHDHRREERQRIEETRHARLNKPGGGWMGTRGCGVVAVRGGAGR